MGNTTSDLMGISSQPSDSGLKDAKGICYRYLGTNVGQPIMQLSSTFSYKLHALGCNTDFGLYSSSALHDNNSILNFMCKIGGVSLTVFCLNILIAICFVSLLSQLGSDG